MCLTFALNVQLEEDVTVYKFLVKHEDGTICSPYYKQGWVEGYEYTPIGDMDIEPCTNLLGETVPDYYHVHGGAFHAYESLQKTVNESIAFALNYDVKDEVVIGKFIIPKDSTVYTKNGYQYATDRIKFIGLVSDEEVEEVIFDGANGLPILNVVKGMKLKDIWKNNQDESKGTD